MRIVDVIREYIVEEILFGDSRGLTEHSGLFDEGILDSMGVLNLVTFIEKKFGIRVADDELVPAHFQNLERIAEYVESKQAASRPAAD